jgi:hypothetical protein
MTQSAVLDRMETVACAIEFLVRVIDEDMRSPDDALDAACELAEPVCPPAVEVAAAIPVKLQQFLSSFGVPGRR